MKKLIVGLLLAISTISLANQEKLYLEEISYVREIVETNATRRFDWRNFEGDNIKYIIEGINEKLTPEVEKRILQIPEKNIVFKSYVFGKETIRVRVLYLKPILESSKK